MAKGSEVAKTSEGIESGIIDANLDTLGKFQATESGITDEMLLDGMSFADITRALGGDVESSQEVLPSLNVLNGEDKQRLVKVPFLAIDWTFRKGDQGFYVSIRCATESGEVYLLNDGSSGIYSQMRQVTERTGKSHGLFCRNGLRRSDYLYTDETTGEQRPATTFYIG